MGIETTLGSLQPNPLQVRLNQMERTAIEMASYYFGGFAAHLSTINGNVQLAHNHPDDIKYRKMAIEGIDFIDAFYARIRFPTLEERREFDPLFTVRRLLPHLRTAVMAALDSYSERAIRELERITQTIEAVGALYRETLFMLIAKIRAYSGKEKFSVSVTDPREPDRITVY